MNANEVVEIKLSEEKIIFAKTKPNYHNNKKLLTTLCKPINILDMSHKVILMVLVEVVAGVEGKEADY